MLKYFQIISIHRKTQTVDTDGRSLKALGPAPEKLHGLTNGFFLITETSLIQTTMRPMNVRMKYFSRIYLNLLEFA